LLTQCTQKKHMKVFHFSSRKADTQYLGRHVNVTSILVANIRLNRNAVFFLCEHDR
jgi:hypothetical protein